VRTLREWDGFGPGAWRHVRIYREVFTEDGTLDQTSTTETKTTLEQIDDSGFTLRVEMTVEVAGKRLTHQPRILWYGFQGQTKGQSVSWEGLPAEPVQVDGQQLDTQPYKITIREDSTRQEIVAHCADFFPYVMRKRSQLIEASGEQQKTSETISRDVIALDLPYKVLAEMKTTSHLRTVHRDADSEVVTIEVHCEDVPGHVVAHWSKKTDAQGRLLERATLELTDYGSGEMQTRRTVVRRPLFGRNRLHRNGR
jgi:hypothetical protein